MPNTVYSHTMNPMCGAVEWDVYDENATHYVFTPITTARQGNRMFCLATAIVMALKQRLPLFVPLRYVLAMHADGFPCVRSSRGLDVKIRGSFTAHIGSRQLEGSISPPFNGSEGVFSLGSWAGFEPTKIREVLQRTFLSRPLNLTERPERHDLVFYYRDLSDCNRWRVRNSEHRKRDAHIGHMHAALAMYSATMQSHRARHPNARLWIQTEACSVRAPIVVKLREMWNGTRIHSTGSKQYDFQWMQSATHIMLTPSTFGWWAAYLSTVAEHIYFPLIEVFTHWGAFTWVELEPHGDPRFRLMHLPPDVEHPLRPPPPAPRPPLLMMNSSRLESDWSAARRRRRRRRDSNP